MSDMLTHWATFEDCRRLAKMDDKIAPLFRELLESRRDIGRLGSVTRGGRKWIPQLLSDARANQGTSKWSEKDERNLALALGCFVHQACDTRMKPLLSRIAGTDWDGMHQKMREGVANIRDDQLAARTQEVSAYYDAEVFRQVYMSGGAEPFSSLFLGEFSPKALGFEDFIRATFQRSLLSSHTMNPDVEHLDSWLDNLFLKVQPLYLDVNLWVRVYNYPDPAKIVEYAVKTDFYDVNDPTISAAQALRSGGALDADLSRAVMHDHKWSCVYGSVLQLGLELLESASRFWNGETDVISIPEKSVTTKAA